MLHCHWKHVFVHNFYNSNHSKSELKGTKIKTKSRCLQYLSQKSKQHTNKCLSDRYIHYPRYVELITNITNEAHFVAPHLQ